MRAPIIASAGEYPGRERAAGAQRLSVRDKGRLRGVGRLRGYLAPVAWLDTCLPALAGIAWEMVVVDDDSPDRTYDTAFAIP